MIEANAASGGRPPRHHTSGLTVLWRGPLSSCNYACPYCPFAKRKDSRRTLAEDKAALERFCGWAASRRFPVTVMFTPWGEALVRKHYREAMIKLSHAPNIFSVAIQTNLSFPVRWIEACNPAKAAFWATYHPGEVSRPTFLESIRRLEEMGVRYSVGVVALREHFDEIECLRAELPSSAYLWINAEDRLQGRYTGAEVERLAAIDPLFDLNNRSYRSRGQACEAGETAISVNGDGEARLCHFIDTPIGNIYDAGFEEALKARTCSRAFCNCHIGYTQLKALDLHGLFGEGFIERRAHAPSRDQALARIAAFGAASKAGQVSTAGR
jgi:MoaA/NifB/PqqE/SkfB family radical SAM enzyme